VIEPVVPDDVVAELPFPRTRAECPVARPCEFAGRCRHGLPGGRCVLDLAAEGEHTLDEIATALGLSHAAATTTLRDALRRLRAAALAEPDIAEEESQRAADRARAERRRARAAAAPAVARHALNE
jgi:hypothetical protein